MSVEEKIDRLIEGQQSISVVVTQQHEEQTKHLQQLLKNHEEHLHPEMQPDHAEQHKRYGGWLRRIDGTWDRVFNALALFILAALGYGLIAVIQAKTGGS